MRLANEVHESGPWRIHAIKRDFRLEDVWEFPVLGRADDFRAFVEILQRLDPLTSGPAAARFLWRLRGRLGAWFGLGSVTTAARTNAAPKGEASESIRDRLPPDLSATAPPSAGTLPFDPLYLTANEFAAEISNRTVHGVMHVSWARRSGDRYVARLAVYVKPRGLLGRAYMRAIAPFRHAIVYPALMREVEKRWDARAVTSAPR